MSKEVYVAFISKKLKEGFEVLKEGKFEDKSLYKFISHAIDDLKANLICGIKVSKKIWPKEYVKKYKITNFMEV